MLDEASKTRINEKVETVTTGAVAKLNQAISGTGFRGGKAAASFRQKDGLTNRIGFKFPRALIFREKGAGKGKGGQKGSQWKNKQGQVVKTNPKSLGKMNTGNRLDKPLINPIIDNYCQDLTASVCDEFVELSFKNIRIK